MDINKISLRNEREITVMDIKNYKNNCQNNKLKIYNPQFQAEISHFCIKN